jgi:hypothetical protein
MEILFAIAAVVTIVSALVKLAESVSSAWRTMRPAKYLGKHFRDKRRRPRQRPSLK